MHSQHRLGTTLLALTKRTEGILYTVDRYFIIYRKNLSLANVQGVKNAHPPSVVAPRF